MSNTLRTMLLLPGLSLFLLACAKPVSEERIPNPLRAQETPLVLAHRGGALIRPENTMPAFEHALELGAHGLELDIHKSMDGELVVIHDFTVERTTQGIGKVEEMDLAELKMLDAGHYFSPHDRPQEHPYRGMGIEIPTLRQVLQRFPDTLLCIEIKPNKPEIAEHLASMLQEHDRVQNTIVSSFHHKVLKRMREILPQVATGASKKEVRRVYFLHRLYLYWLYTPKAEVLQVPEKVGSIQLARPGLIRQAQDKGQLAQVWTVNQASNMRKYLDLDVHGIITDRPDLLLQILREEREKKAPGEP
ncbi:MAG: glycerophosphodiester phosphodiesterase [Desulfohalobiaceae bacterium]